MDEYINSGKYTQTEGNLFCFVWYSRHHVAKLKWIDITEFGPCQKINKK